MLKVIEEKQKLDEQVIQEVLKILSECDGFVLLSSKGDEMLWRRYELSDLEALYLLEWGKISLMTNGQS